MTKFQATIEDGAVIDARRADVWAALTDPDVLAELTPLLRRIDADGDIWTWQLTKIAALGVAISPSFTEKMSFEDGRVIQYTHVPPPGVTERAGAEGRYDLSDAPDGTQLHITLTLCIDLPLPKAAGPAVRKVMSTMMDRTGDRFSANLLRHLNARELRAA